jgi:hypothetical protein
MLRDKVDIDILYANYCGSHLPSRALVRLSKFTYIVPRGFRPFRAL